VLSLLILQFFVRCFNDRVLILGTTFLSLVGFVLLIDLQSQYVDLAKFGVAASLSAAGYSSNVSLLISIYSKVLEAHDQGMMMGWLTSSASVARMIGPIIASYSMQYGGPRLVFLLMISITILTLIVLVLRYAK